MQINLHNHQHADRMNVLLIGNNPIDMSTILKKLNQINGKKIATEIAFDVQSILERLMKFKPHYILIDDNVGKQMLYQTVDTLTNTKKSKGIPIAVLKNSNYQESYSGSAMLDYILKNNLTSESLYKTLVNSLRLKKTQEYLLKVYQKRRGRLKDIFK